MKTKVLLIVSGALLVIGSIVGMHIGREDCPFKDTKPCQMLKGK